jgi:predicted aspartyl protease
LKTIPILTALAAAYLTAPAMADDACPPLQMISNVTMTLGDDGRPYVPVRIGDKDKTMLVDTGGAFTEITPATVEELGLRPRVTRLNLVGVTGSEQRLAVRTSLVLGNLTAPATDFMVMTGANPIDSSLDSSVPGAAGILAPNLLHAYDLDMDFGGRKVALLSQDHCPGKVVYWPADAVAVVPFRLDDSNHIFVQVTLDGVRLDAMLDTGASDSVLNLDKALLEYHLKPGDAETPVSHDLVDNVATYQHRFHALSLEGLAVGNPQMTLMPDLMKSRFGNTHDSLKGGSRLKVLDAQTGLGDMILGMNVLHHLHLYIAYKEHKLYITPAVTAPEKAAPH